MKNFKKNNRQIMQGWFALAVLLSAFSLSGQTGGGVFTAGPAMKRAKIYPMATALDNGKVISFGGREYNFISCAYAEMYDPTSNTFSEKAMNTPRDGSVVVKLSDGRYMILGGSKDLGVAPGYATTEIYNPATDSFTAMASMNLSRMQLGAVQLTGGKILVAGAWYNTSGATAGELYDFTSNTFTNTGALNHPRAQPIVLPTSDGGAVIAGGWPTYGGAIMESVEYYQTATNDFVNVSNKLISSDSGWLLLPSYTRPVSDNRMSNGNYLLMAYRTFPTVQYALITFNPSTKQFTKLVTTKPLKDSLTDGGFIDFVLNKTDNLAYLMGVDSIPVPQKLCLVTVNLSTGEIFHPTTSYTLPSDQFLYPAMTYMPSNGKILIQGVNAVNTSYFKGTDKTYLLTPQKYTSVQRIEGRDIKSFNCFPNPATDALNVRIELLQPCNYSVRLTDMMGKEIWTKNNVSNTAGSISDTFDTAGLPQGHYVISLLTPGVSISRNIVILR